MINNNKGSRIYICGVDNRSLGGDVMASMYVCACVITRGSLQPLRGRGGVIQVEDVTKYIGEGLTTSTFNQSHTLAHLEIKVVKN